jgi:hypothetical protein
MSGGNPRADILVGFDQTIAAIGQQIGTISREPGKLQLSVTLEAETAVGPALAQFASALAKFEVLCKSVQARGIVHHGVVFRNEVAGKVTYIGSAIRASQSALRKMAATSGLVATRGFIAHANGLNPPVAQFDPLDGSDAADGLCRIRIVGKTEAVTAKRSGLTSADPEFLAYLIKRLAEHLGPFASAIVENQRNGFPTPEQLVAEMAREIDEPGVRKQFKADLDAYISACNKA